MTAVFGNRNYIGGIPTYAHRKYHPYVYIYVCHKCHVSFPQCFRGVRMTLYDTLPLEVVHA